MSSTPNWTEIVTAGLVAAQLAVLVVAALVAWSQAREARRLREDQSRPFVVLDVDFMGSSLLFLFVKNIGTSLARDVRIAVDPPLTTSLDFDMGAIKMLGDDGIPTLAPGKELRTLFDMGFRRHEAGLPLLYSVTITYTDDRGERKFSEATFLDIEQYTHMRFVDRKDIHNVYKAMEKMQRTFDKWTSGLARRSRGGKKLSGRFPLRPRRSRGRGPARALRRQLVAHRRRGARRTGPGVPGRRPSSARRALGSRCRPGRSSGERSPGERSSRWGPPGSCSRP